MINTKYIAYIIDHGHEAGSIDYDMQFTSIKEAMEYIRSLPSNRCCGRLDKITLVDSEWFSDTIMHF